MKSKGVLLLYSESAQLDYKRLADIAARLAENYLDVPAAVVKIDPVQKNSRTFRYDDGVETTEWNNIAVGMLQAMKFLDMTASYKMAAVDLKCAGQQYVTLKSQHMHSVYSVLGIWYMKTMRTTANYLDLN